MKWYPSDYLGDTPPISPATYAHHGIYSLLLWKAWLSPGRRLPADKRWLALHMGCTEAQVAEHIIPVLQMYFVKRRSWWINPRQESDFAKAVSFSEKQSRNRKARDNKEKTPTKRQPEKQSGTTRARVLEPRTQNPEPRTQITPPSPPTGGFAEFFVAYPRKVGKRAAERAYDRAAKAVGHAALMEGLKRSAAVWEADGRDYDKIPHPSKWLREGRWEDEEEIPSGRATSKRGNGRDHSPSTAGGLRAAERIRRRRGKVGDPADPSSPGLPAKENER